MSQAYPVRDYSLMVQGLAWAGVALGIVGYCATVPLATSHRPLYAMSPEQLTTWVAAVCSAVMAVVNTGFVIYHRFQHPRKPRKPRRKKPDASSPAGAA